MKNEANNEAYDGTSTEAGEGPAPEAREGTPALGGWGAASQGGDSGITHPANRQWTEKPPLETGGEDTLYLALNVWWKDDFQGVMEKLEWGKLEAQRLGRNAEVEIAGKKFVVSRQGKKTGAGRGRFYRYLVHHSGLTLLLTDQPQAVEQTPNVLVEIGSTTLLLVGGAGNAVADLRTLFEQLGGYILWDKISRVDLCVDLPGVAMGDFQRLIEADHDVTRAMIDTLYRRGRKATGYSFGSGSVVLRIYDKLLEVTGPSGDPFKYALLCQRRWGNSPRCAVRVEFQLRREMLTSAKISSVGDYLRNRAALARYLTHEWFRLAESPPDRENNNTTRAETHPLWITVQEAFAAWTGVATDSIHRLKVRPEVDPIRLAKQGRGCFLAAIAELDGVESMSENELRKKAMQILDWAFDHDGPTQTVERFEEKRLRTKKRKS